MKLLAVALLVFGMLCNSVLATAEDPVPFRALMQAAGAQPNVPRISDAKDQSTAVSTQPSHTPHMTTGGKAMIGVGIGMLAIGGVVILTTNSVSGLTTSTDKAALYGAGGGAMAGGAVLIVLGAHRRSAQ
jgi:hypothetical protein